MPDPPPGKRTYRLPAKGVREPPALPGYAELHAKTNFSFLEGASHPDELAAQAAQLSYAALAVTDRDSLAGVVRAHVAAKEVDLKLLVGAEVAPVEAPCLVLLAIDRAGYGRLARLLTLGRRRAPKGQCELTLDDLADHAEGLLGLCPLQQTTLDLKERRARRTLPTLHDLRAYRDIFGDRCYALAELHRGPDDEEHLQRSVALAVRARLPLAAANDVRYHVRRRRALADVLTAVRAGATVTGAGPLLEANAERYLKSPTDMAALFAAAPGAVARTLEIADRCRFSLDELRYEYPEELCPAGSNPTEYLIGLAWQGAAIRYPGGIPDKVRGLLEYELKLIEELRYEAYFLTVWDLVRFARSRGILCQGRGSAANSAVCYCLGVTAVDPDRLDLLFERFISRERDEAPDIDLDFEHERREEVLQYVYDKYGRDRAGMTAEVITYRPRSAVRDVGKALGLSLDRVDALAKTLDGYHHESCWEDRCRDAGLDPQSPVGRRLVQLVGELLGFPRHLSQHVGGMVITRGPLSELCAIENAAMAGRTVIQWDKDDLDELGILKVDCLALGMLTAIRKCFELVERHWGRKLTLADVPEGDAQVYEMICRADTLGVFQIESRAQMSMLPRLRPREFYDLVIEVAIVRPGPIQGKMVHPYLRRRAGLEPIGYPNDEIKAVLDKTMGVPIFQEQAMRLAVVAAGFTPGEADQLRRAMGAWRRTGVIEQFHERLIAGMLARGLSQEFADRVFEQIRGFGEYGFPESHAASFALLVYVSAWLKHYYPAAFAAAILNSQPMGFYAPAQLVRDARTHGVEVLPADVNASEWDCTLEAESHTLQSEKNPPSAFRPPPWFALRLGLRSLAGLPTASAEAIVTARRSGPFTSVEDFARRTRLSRAVMAKLAKADALGSLRLHRRAALWHVLSQGDKPRELPLFEKIEPAADRSLEALPALNAYEEVLADYRTGGLSLRGHPLAFWRSELDRYQVVRSEELATLPTGRYLRVAGLVLVRQRPGTARGITFVTLEDETGVANLIVRPDVWQRYRTAAKNAAALIAHGRLERHETVIHLLVAKLEDLTHVLGSDGARSDQPLRSQSRDFR